MQLLSLISFVVVLLGLFASATAHYGGRYRGGGGRYRYGGGGGYRWGGGGGYRYGGSRYRGGVGYVGVKYGGGYYHG